jgi:ATP-binding cassette subfamily B (MDR/TAP) protein 1
MSYFCNLTQRRATLNQAGLYVTIIGIVAGVVGFAANFLFVFAGQRVANRVRRAYFNSLTTQEIGYFDIKKGGALAHTLSYDIATFTDALAVHLQQVIILHEFSLIFNSLPNFLHNSSLV